MKNRPLLLIILLAITCPAVSAGRLKILLTNDDGFNAPGIRAVQSALKAAGHDVYLIAPATQQSGASASFTGKGVTLTAYPDQVWAVDGTPADSVRVGLGNILYKDPPDLVVAGANFGQNTGKDIILSGTVGAAVTAWSLKYPAIAISVELKGSERQLGFPTTLAAFKGAASLLVKIISNLDIEKMVGVLNINYPAVLPLDVRGVRWSNLSSHGFIGERYYRDQNGLYRAEIKIPHPNSRRHDAESLVDGYVTLTYLDGDMAMPVSRIQKSLVRDLLVPMITTTGSGTPKKAGKSRPEKEIRKPVIVEDSEPDIVFTSNIGAEVEAVTGQAEQTVESLVESPDVRKDEPTVEPTDQPVAVILDESTIETRVESKMEVEVTAPPKETAVPGELANQGTAATTSLDNPSPNETKQEEAEMEDASFESPETPVTKAPDSWLRRIFKPSKW